MGEYNINVNAVAPGAVKNPREQAIPEHKKRTGLIMQMQCIKRREQYEDLVGAVVFLASDESDMITGQTIMVDGGWILH